MTPAFSRRVPPRNLAPFSLAARAVAAPLPSSRRRSNQHDEMPGARSPRRRATGIGESSQRTVTLRILSLCEAL